MILGTGRLGTGRFLGGVRRGITFFLSLLPVEIHELSIVRHGEPGTRDQARVIAPSGGTLGGTWERAELFPGRSAERHLFNGFRAARFDLVPVLDSSYYY